MPPDSLRLLALDGGGVRGLSALMILEGLMEAVDADNPPKPCDYIDMIGGTGTLGRLKMIIDECIDAIPFVVRSCVRDESASDKPQRQDSG